MVPRENHWTRNDPLSLDAVVRKDSSNVWMIRPFVSSRGEWDVRVKSKRRALQRERDMGEIARGTLAGAAGRSPQAIRQAFFLWFYFYVP
jgi:hypothetical protein